MSHCTEEGSHWCTAQEVWWDNNEEDLGLIGGLIWDRTATRRVPGFQRSLGGHNALRCNVCVLVLLKCNYSLDELSSGKERERVLPNSTIKWGYNCHGAEGCCLKVGKWIEYWIWCIQKSETNDRGRWTWQVSWRMSRPVLHRPDLYEGSGGQGLA